MQLQRIYMLAAFTAVFAGTTATLSAGEHGNGKPTVFVVRVENISNKDGQAASDGTRWPFALSPGLWVVHGKEVRLFREGAAAGTGIERQAEDGNPGELVKTLESRAHDTMRHGVFNSPVGGSEPGPIGPGGSYEFRISAAPGTRLSMVMMFGQSNDWFYAPTAEGIALFESGRPVSGDITSRFVLYDAGTEKDEEPGIGPNQGPRQKAPNTGEDEHGVVHKASQSPFFTKTSELFRVTIAPEEKIDVTAR